jgi:hypothetical protein
MTSAAVTAITDVLLALEAMLLSYVLTRIPCIRSSALWHWRIALGAMGLGVLIGAVHHGWFPPPSAPGYWIERVDWAVLAAMTYFFLMAAAAQFFPASVWRTVQAMGVAQFVGNTLLVLFVDNFLVVTLNYGPVMVLLFAANFRGLGTGTGSWPMLYGLSLLLVGAAIQASGVDALTPLDHNGLYHLVSMLGVWFLFLAGRQLNRA